MSRNIITTFFLIVSTITSLAQKSIDNLQNIQPDAYSGGNVNTILPNTQITVSVPTTKYSMAVKIEKHKGRGIIPDYVVIASIKDYLQGKDVQVAYAIKLARQNNNR